MIKISSLYLLHLSGRENGVGCCLPYACLMYSSLPKNVHMLFVLQTLEFDQMTVNFVQKLYSHSTLDGEECIIYIILCGLYFKNTFTNNLWFNQPGGYCREQFCLSILAILSRGCICTVLSNSERHQTPNSSPAILESGQPG